MEVTAVGGFEGGAATRQAVGPVNAAAEGGERFGFGVGTGDRSTNFIGPLLNPVSHEIGVELRIEVASDLERNGDKIDVGASRQEFQELAVATVVGVKRHSVQSRAGGIPRGWGAQMSKPMIAAAIPVAAADSSVERANVATQDRASCVCGVGLPSEAHSRRQRGPAERG